MNSQWKIAGLLICGTLAACGDTNTARMTRLADYDGKPLEITKHTVVTNQNGVPVKFDPTIARGNKNVFDDHGFVTEEKKVGVAVGWRSPPGVVAEGTNVTTLPFPTDEICAVRTQASIMHSHDKIIKQIDPQTKQDNVALTQTYDSAACESPLTARVIQANPNASVLEQVALPLAAGIEGGLNVAAQAVRRPDNNRTEVNQTGGGASSTSSAQGGAGGVGNGGVGNGGSGTAISGSESSSSSSSRALAHQQQGQGQSQNQKQGQSQGQGQTSNVTMPSGKSHGHMPMMPMQGADKHAQYKNVVAGERVMGRRERKTFPTPSFV